MKGLIVYSSLSGNTKKIAEAIAEVAEDSELISVREFQSSMLANFDLFYIGYWVDKGEAAGGVPRRTQSHTRALSVSGCCR